MYAGTHMGEISDYTVMVYRCCRVDYTPGADYRPGTGNTAGSQKTAVSCFGFGFNYRRSMLKRDRLKSTFRDFSGDAFPCCVITNGNMCKRYSLLKKTRQKAPVACYSTVYQLSARCNTIIDYCGYLPFVAAGNSRFDYRSMTSRSYQDQLFSLMLRHNYLRLIEGYYTSYFTFLL
jgi:hypothetical protein